MTEEKKLPKLVKKNYEGELYVMDVPRDVDAEAVREFVGNLEDYIDALKFVCEESRTLRYEMRTLRRINEDLKDVPKLQEELLTAVKAWADNRRTLIDSGKLMGDELNLLNAVERLAYYNV